MRRPVLIALLLVACGEDGPPPDLVADVRRLDEVVAADPALESIDAADAIADDRPVHAARMLRTSAIPAAERQVAAFEDVETSTPEGRSFARRLGRAYQARLDALHTWRDVLELGAGADPVDALDAVRERREAQEQLLDVVDAMRETIPGFDRPQRPQNPPADEPEPGALTGDGTEPTSPP